ncbi:MAG: hypothetical protein JWL87_542 [Candidatus Adlerbacteria bacterium]|nr:hypothetical protein [Candidatus Adlerbacteria bacterium]
MTRFVDCDPNLREMEEKLVEARAAGHTRMFALGYEPDLPMQWHSRKDEQKMKEYLDSREKSESTLFNCAVAVVVVNPQDSDETIKSIIAAKQPRKNEGPGYFCEAW